MYLLSLLMILITSFKSIFSLKNEYISNCNYNLRRLRNNTFITESEYFGDCNCLPTYGQFIDYIKNITDLNFTKIIICTLNCWKHNSTEFIIFANYSKNFLNLFGPIIFGDLDKMSKLIYNITKKIVNNDTMVNQFAEIIKPKNNKTIFADLIIELLNKPGKWANMSKNYTYDFLSRLLNITGFIPLFNGVYKVSKNDILDLTQEFFLTFYPEIGNIFVLLRKELNNILDDILTLIFQIIKNYKDRDTVLDLIRDFALAHNSSYDKIKEVMLNDTMKVFYELVIFKDDEFLIQTKDLLLKKKETLEMLLNIMKNNESLILGTELLKHMDNFTFLNESLPKFIKLAVKNNSIVDPLTEFFFALILDTTNNRDELTLNFFRALSLFIEAKINNLDYSKFNMSKDCKELIEYTFRNFLTNDNSLPFLYFQKYFFDSSRNKGNFLPFDNCLDESYKIKTPLKYNISPAFIIGIVNEENQKRENKDSSFYFKYIYLRSYCLPFSYKNESQEKENNPMCSNEDYQKIFSILYNLFWNISQANITVFSINRFNKSPSALHNLYGVLGILFLGFPILIYIFLLISRKVIENKQKEINENIKKQKTIKNELIKVNKRTKRKKIIYPKWYQYLNEFFNIAKNGNELFNFSENFTNYNNFKGMTYIKGTIGIFLILTIFGHTFIALLNLPSKGYGIWDYNWVMSNPLYFILFIGYRDSPRILFSCSGYILIYKYLCYIEQEPRLYFLKFIFLQSYRYILLIFFIIIIRYPLYYIVFLMRQTKRPTWEVFKYFIDKEKNYLIRFFTFLLYLNEDDSSMKQKLIFYYYIPINEVIFFIFGTALISLGYKFKLRIDIIIFVLILLLYFLKVLLYIIIQDKVYTTNDYYLFDYGLYQIHPLFNLSYFLIGIFFGLINYSIQKGITDLEEKNDYKNIFLLSDSKIINNDDNGDEESQTIKKKNTFSLEDSNIDKNELNLNNISKIDDTLSEKSSHNNKLFGNFNNSIEKNKKYRNKRIKDINDINSDSSENFEKYLDEESELGSKKVEYSERIKQMPFLIWPILFSNFHKKNKNKLILNIVIIITFFLLIFFIFAQFLFVLAKVKEDIFGEKIAKELSFRKIICEIGLNIIFLLDIEIVIFIIQWINFILDFKEVRLIKNFLNHVYWSFFVKSYFSFCLTSVTVILFLFFLTETAIKFNLGNIFLYGFIDLIFTLILTIVFYSCFELPFKKFIKFLLKGKEALNNEEDKDELEEEQIINVQKINI